MRRSFITYRMTLINKCTKTSRLVKNEKKSVHLSGIILERVKAGTDYGTYSTAQPDAASKNMMFASVDSQQTCSEHAMNMFRGRAVLPRNEPKIVGFQDEHEGIPCPRMLVQPSRSGSLCHKNFLQIFEHHVRGCRGGCAAEHVS